MDVPAARGAPPDRAWMYCRCRAWARVPFFPPFTAFTRAAAGAGIWYLVRRTNAAREARKTKDTALVVLEKKKVGESAALLGARACVAERWGSGVNKEFVEQISQILPTLFPSFFCREVALLGCHTVYGRWLRDLGGE